MTKNTAKRKNHGVNGRQLFGTFASARAQKHVPQVITKYCMKPKILFIDIKLKVEFRN